jgi:hypothetical protein
VSLPFPSLHATPNRKTRQLTKTKTKTKTVNVSLGASIAEIVSAYPTAGGLYTASANLVPRKHRAMYVLDVAASSRRRRRMWRRLVVLRWAAGAVSEDLSAHRAFFWDVFTASDGLLGGSTC